MKSSIKFGFQQKNNLIKTKKLSLMVREVLTDKVKTKKLRKISSNS